MGIEEEKSCSSPSKLQRFGRIQNTESDDLRTSAIRRDGSVPCGPCPTFTQDGRTCKKDLEQQLMELLKKEGRKYKKRKYEPIRCLCEPCNEGSARQSSSLSFAARGPGSRKANK